MRTLHSLTRGTLLARVFYARCSQCIQHGRTHHEHQLGHDTLSLLGEREDVWRCWWLWWRWCCGCGDAGASDGCDGSWIAVNISSLDNIASEGRIEATGFNSAWYTSQPSSWSGHAVFTHRMGVVSFFTLAFFTWCCSFFTWGCSFFTLGSCSFFGSAFLFFPWPLSFEALVFFSVGVKTLLISPRAVCISSTCAEVFFPPVSWRECFWVKLPTHKSPQNRKFADAIKSDESSPNRIHSYFWVLTPSKVTNPPQIESSSIFGCWRHQKWRILPKPNPHLFLGADAIKSDESSPNRIHIYFLVLTPSKVTNPPQIESSSIFGCWRHQKWRILPKSNPHLFFGADAIKSDESSPNRILIYFWVLTPSKVTNPPQIESPSILGCWRHHHQWQSQHPIRFMVPCISQWQRVSHVVSRQHLTTHITDFFTHFHHFSVDFNLPTQFFNVLFFFWRSLFHTTMACTFPDLCLADLLRTTSPSRLTSTTS